MLQVVGNEHRPFLYDIDWGESVSLQSLHDAGGGTVQFRPDASDELLRLAPLLRPLIEVHWVRMVASLNGLDVEGERLREHLFGATRSAFPSTLSSGLRELQDDRCFYCGEQLRRRVEIDHFVPWSRWPNDAVETPDRTLAIGRSGYFHLPTGTPLWLLGGSFTDEDPRTIAAELTT